METLPHKPKSRIFLLDDHAAARSGLRRLIESEADLGVCGDARDVEEALRAIPAAAPDTVIVSLDPIDAGGPGPVERLRWAHPEIPLIVISLKEPGAHGRRMIQSGAAGYVTRALAAAEIIPAIRAVLKGGVHAGGGARGRRGKGGV